MAIITEKYFVDEDETAIRTYVPASGKCAINIWSHGSYEETGECFIFSEIDEFEQFINDLQEILKTAKQNGTR